MFRSSAATLLALAVTFAGFTPFAGLPRCSAQDVPGAPAPATLWRFLGIPQGMQKIRDVSVNRRGNFPGLERKPPLKRIGDPANLESDNPAIKAAAEIKQAEDMKEQKVKAIKYLASIGCGCYDKDGKITDALLAATDDCTPDVRMAAIEAIEEAANGEQCQRCGSTSCCSEKVTKRLSEIAYERDDDGCPLEPDAEIREAAARVLRVCCPGGPALGPVAEDVDTPEPEADEIIIEGADEGQEIRGETIDDGTALPDGGRGGDGTPETLPPADIDPLSLMRSAGYRPEGITLGQMREVGGMKVQPVTFAGDPAQKPQASRREASRDLSHPRPVATGKPGAETPRQPLEGTVVAVNYRTGEVEIRANGRSRIRDNASVTIYRDFLTGERLIAHLLVRQSQGSSAKAVVTDPAMLRLVRQGDRAVCH